MGEDKLAMDSKGHIHRLEDLTEAERRKTVSIPLDDEGRVNRLNRKE